MVLVKQIIEKFGCIDFLGKIDTMVTEVAQLQIANQREDHLFWCNDANINKLDTINKGTIICSKLALEQKINPQQNLIIVENPRLYFSRVVKNFFYHPPSRENISKTAYIHPTSVIGNNCFIGENVVIEENCIIGNNCLIGHNTVLHYDTIVKDNVIIGCNNTIGGFGYGYEKNEEGAYEPIPHIGNVIIEQNVEICNNTCIDRAAIGSTHIKENVKISNLVHIGHGVKVGSNSMLIANSMIGGSSIIGENVWISPSASIINKITIGDNATIGLSAVVIRPVKNNTVVVGNPARELNKKNNL